MRFCWCTIKTKEMEKSREFYGGFLGMRAERSSSPAPGTEIVFFSDENRMEVELISKEEIPEWQGECPVTIGLAKPLKDNIRTGIPCPEQKPKT